MKMSNKSSHIIFLIQSFEQPRILKKIIEKASEYKKVYVYGFTRKIHAVNNYELLNEYGNIEYKIVASLEDGKYLQRLWAYFKLLVLLYQKFGFKEKQLYVVGIDLRMISSFLVKKKIEYVISDIMWLYFPRFKKNILRVIDTHMAKKSHKVLFTSRGFYEAHYKNQVSEEQLVITENKLATYNKVSPLQFIKTDTIRIAYIGAFRYTEIIKNLIKTVIDNQNLILNFYGDGQSYIVDLMKDNALKYNNITFNGSFRNPDDLERIYSENNLNFVVYNNTLENEQVAMPNKFYESGFFNVPILCATNTYVGQRALDQDMGWVCDIDQKSISDFLNSLNIQDITECHERIKRLDKGFFAC